MAAVGAGGPGRWAEFTSHCFPCPGFVAVVWSHPDTAQPGARWCGCLTLRLVLGCDFTRGPGRAFSGLLGHGCSGVNGAAGLGSGVAERRGGLPGTCGHWGVPGRVPRGVGPGGRAGAAPPPFLSQLSAEWVAQGPPWVRQQGTPALALSSPQDGEDGLGGLPLSVASGTPPPGSDRCLEPAFSAIPRGRQRPEGWKRRLCRGPPPCVCACTRVRTHTHAHACTPLIGRRPAALC